MTVSKMAALGALMLACILLVWMVVGSRKPATETQGVAAVVKGETYEDAGLGFAWIAPLRRCCRSTEPTSGCWKSRP